ncbi:cytochrome c oxidase subunit 3 [Sphingomonas dokdonensis]|uniref:Cytochrome bo(3) ubiquinol oxidase subunit 3 n=1 Tax=Sphingomonas dokdonensis TaxID=344880 RepID=A0A245ZI56_9SPHN|nr:cytochrome c oxidase subunit 3 [Sphingomonas dokdonensis]OWK29425.1 cytochrome bo(3) ubiquinol oxidase subunit 3 [Sphingomonas dokdonensis]
MTQPSLRHAGINLGGTQEDPNADAESGIFGFWMFLMSDAVIFALLFAIYGTAVAATAGGPTPRSEFKLDSALIETLLLLTSSLTVGMGVLAMKYDATRRPVFAWMGVTLALGIAFLFMEWHDFSTMFSHGAYPTRSAFLSSFFALVPLHGLHVLAGCIWMLVMGAQVLAYGFDTRVKINILRLSLFWHFLDVIWIAILTVVYLQGHVS